MLTLEDCDFTLNYFCSKIQVLLREIDGLVRYKV